MGGKRWVVLEGRITRVSRLLLERWANHLPSPAVEPQPMVLSRRIEAKKHPPTPRTLLTRPPRWTYPQAPLGAKQVCDPRVTCSSPSPIVLVKLETLI